MRLRVLLPAAVGMLLLAGPASAAAQEGEYLLGLPSAGQAREAVPAAQESTPEQPQADVAQTPPAETETETEPTEEPGPAEPQGDSDGVPQQYTDPLAGENQDDAQQQPAETSTPASGVQQVSAGSASQLPSTGAPTGLLALAGAAFLAVGVALRLLARDAVYPYSLPRY